LQELLESDEFTKKDIEEINEWKTKPDQAAKLRKFFKKHSQRFEYSYHST